VVRNPGCNLRLASGIAPMARYLAAGVRLAIGTDNHALADDEDLLAELRLAGVLAREPGWGAPPAPTTDDLLAMATVNGAVAAQWGGEIGRIAPGCLADLAAFSLKRTREPVLDPDTPLLDAFLARANGADVRLTMVGGRVLYRDGRFADPSLMEAAETAAVASARAGRRPADPENLGRSLRLHGRLCDHYRGLSPTRTFTCKTS
jgi:cytosine/adenosine deaminase-related metal-dependent hydrolase